MSAREEPLIPNNPEKFCVYSDGVTGECWCQEPINRWGRGRVTE
ncbi:hypothetical protein CYFUS_001587 [Cystobacter fuscus]|uniref:Uncharacterized protein n=1 Tax=Cystobacter fuscus TaxID=43 RepID=A0A250IY15_9BACT|nr:hypothetical protein CYFUS_001587 [Cystobacter fuscus]